MAFKSDLLNSLSQTQPITNDMPVIRLVKPDIEPVIEIDADLRKITVPDELKNIGVAGDHLAETIYFQCPRFFDDIDLTTHTCIIRFINAGNEYDEANAVDIEEGTDYIKFGWTIDNRVTRYSGTVNFTVQFETVSDGVKYQWQTTPATLNVLAGLNIEETITDKDDSLFRTLTNRIEDLERQVNELVDVNTTIAQMIEKINKNIEDIQYLENNVVYVLDESEVDN